MRGVVEITNEEYLQLKMDSFWLLCMENSGIDNCEAYNLAIDRRDEYMDAWTDLEEWQERAMKKWDPDNEKIREGRHE